MSRHIDDSMAPRPRPSLGANLRRLRNERGISQRRLEEISGVARAVITRLEGGMQTSAGLDTIEDLARALGVTSDELIAPQVGESEGSELRALIDDFEQQERGEIPDRPPVIYAQPEEIEWLRSLPRMMWETCPPTVDVLVAFVNGFRRRNRNPAK